MISLRTRTLALRLPTTAIRWAILSRFEPSPFPGLRGETERRVQWAQRYAASPELYETRKQAREACARQNHPYWAANGFYWSPVKVRVTLEAM